MKNKYLYNNISIKKVDKIIYGRYPDLYWCANIKDKTALFAKKNKKYEEKNIKKTAKQLRKKKLRIK